MSFDVFRLWEKCSKWRPRFEQEESLDLFLLLEEFWLFLFDRFYGWKLVFRNQVQSALWRKIELPLLAQPSCLFWNAFWGGIGLPFMNETYNNYSISDDETRPNQWNHGQLQGWDMDIPIHGWRAISNTDVSNLLICHIHLLVYFWMSTWLWLGVAWFDVNSCSTSVWLWLLSQYSQICDFQPHLFEDNELWTKNTIFHSTSIHWRSTPRQVAAVFAYIQSVSAFAGDDTSALSCFISFVRIFMPCFYDGESFLGGFWKEKLREVSRFRGKKSMESLEHIS